MVGMEVEDAETHGYCAMDKGVIVIIQEHEHEEPQREREY